MRQDFILFFNFLLKSFRTIYFFLFKLFRTIFLFKLFRITSLTLLPGASVTEVELVKQLTSFGEVLIYLKYYMSLEQFFFIQIILNIICFIQVISNNLNYFEQYFLFKFNYLNNFLFKLLFFLNKLD